MKEKLWFLLVDSIQNYYAGANSVMNNAIDISFDVFCEIEALDKAKVWEQIQSCRNEAMDAFNGGWLFDDKQYKAFQELLKYKLIKLKERIDNGYYKEES